MAHADLFTFSSSALPDNTKLLNFRLVEAISTPFELVVHFITTTPDDVDFANAVGAKAQLSADRGDGGPNMQWGGVFAGIEHLHQATEGAFFRGLIVPPAWFLAQGEHSRIFTKKSLKDFVTEVMEDAGLSSSDFEFRLGSDPPAEEHVCQYRESDLAFIHRWLEREGLFYFFEHSDDGPKMVIADKNPTESLRKARVPYVASLSRDNTSQETIQRFRASRRGTLASIKLRDYDYMKPMLDVKGKADASTTGLTELSRFGDRFITPADGARLAKIKAEAVLAREEVYELSGTTLQLRTGYTFELENHPRDAFNKKYLATRIEHLGVQRGAAKPEYAEYLGLAGDEVYRVEVQATDTALPYRPERVTPWPRISGQEIAIIDGPADSNYAQLDDAGRYLVTFMFDENKHDAGKASTLVRMMQPHAGNPEGFHFPLRKGTEVVIIFLGGDPDRPVIAGAVPNAANPSPVTSKNNTHNIIITGGKNIIEMEDQDGQQWINIFTPTENTEIHMGDPKEFKGVGKSGATVKANLGEHTDGDAVFTIGGDWRINVGKEKEEHVVSNVIEDYDAKVDETYKGPKNETVTNKVTEKFNAGHETTVTGLRKSTVTGAMEETITAGLTQTISSGRTQTVNGASTCHWTTSATHDGPKLHEKFATHIIEAGTLLNEKAPTGDFDFGEWKVKAGPVTWNHGPIIWNAPSATLAIPNWENTSASTWSTGLNAQTAYVFTTAFAAVAIAIAGLNLGVAGVNIGVAVGLNIGLKGLYLENKGINLATGGLKAQLKGLTAFA